MGHKQGVQARILQMNEKALCVPCNSHTLNLVVTDAAKYSVVSNTFFGVLQRLYNLSSSSVQHWALLKEHVKQLTVKPLSVTRWEARTDSVKGVRYHLLEIIQALSALKTLSMQNKEPRDSPRQPALRMKWSFVLEKTLHDIDSEDLVLEIRAAVHAFPDHVSASPREMLDYIHKEQILDLYGNLSIALRLLLTLLVTVASGERSFSTLKLIKTYLRSTMSQERPS